MRGQTTGLAHNSHLSVGKRPDQAEAVSAAWPGGATRAPQHDRPEPIPILRWSEEKLTPRHPPLHESKQMLCIRSNRTMVLAFCSLVERVARWDNRASHTALRRRDIDMATRDLLCRSAWWLKAVLIVMAFVALIKPGLTAQQYEPVGAFVTADDLAGQCFPEAPFPKKRACWGYILGITDMELAGHRICIPDRKDFDVPKLTDMVTRHLRVFSGPLRLAAAPIVDDFLENSFPCNKTAKEPIGAYWSLARLRGECVREGPNDEKVLCNAYIVGAVDALQDLVARDICIPQGFDNERLVAWVIGYIQCCHFFTEGSTDPPGAPAALTLVKFAEKYFSCKANR